MAIQYDFDQEFQRGLLAAFLTDKAVLAGGLGVVQAAHFTDELTGGVFAAVKSFFEKEHRTPDLGILLEELKDHVAPGRKWGEYADEARKVWRRRGSNPDFYRRSAVEFARKAAVVEAVGGAHRFLEEGDLDSLVSTITKAVRVGTGLSGGPYDYFQKFKSRLRHYLGREDGEQVRRVPSGIGPLDSITQGGLGDGEFGLVVGLAGGGKSTILTNFGADAVMKGHNVLHVSLENSQAVVASRYDMKFFGPMHDIVKKPKSFLKAMAKLKETLAGRLKIQYFPTKSLTVPQLIAFASGVEPVPDLMIVDYADLLRPVKKRDDKYIELTDVYEDLRRAAGELGVPTWSASQANRPSMGKRIIDMDGVAGAFDKSGIVDVGVSVCGDEAAVRRGEITLFVMKNRLGKAGVEIACAADWEKQTVKALLDAV